MRKLLGTQSAIMRIWYGRMNATVTEEHIISLRIDHPSSVRRQLTALAKPVMAREALIKPALRTDRYILTAAGRQYIRELEERE